MSAKAQTILSDNIANASDGTETATGATWLAFGFATDAGVYDLNTITLLLQDTSGAGTTGTAELDLYTDGGLEPGSFVGALTTPATVSSSALADTTFTPAASRWRRTRPTGRSSRPTAARSAGRGPPTTPGAARALRTPGTRATTPARPGSATTPRRPR